MKKPIWIVAILCGVGVSGGLAFAWLRPKPAPDPKANPQVLADYLTSDSFKKLPEEGKQKYLDQVMEGRSKEDMKALADLSEEQRNKLRQAMGSLFRARMAKNVDQYFSLPPEKRVAYLDELLDKFRGFRGHGAPGGPEGPEGDHGGPGAGGPHGPGGPGFTPERMKEMIESTPPEQRAQFSEFMKAMHDRAQERGMGRP